MAVISDIPKNLNFRERFVNRMKVFIQNYSEARSIANTIRELNKLSDRDLADLGISRSEISSKVRIASIRN